MAANSVISRLPAGRWDHFIPAIWTSTHKDRSDNLMRDARPFHKFRIVSQFLGDLLNLSLNLGRKRVKCAFRPGGFQWIDIVVASAPLSRTIMRTTFSGLCAPGRFGRKPTNDTRRPESMAMPACSFFVAGAAFPSWSPERHHDRFVPTHGFLEEFFSTQAANASMNFMRNWRVVSLAILPLPSNSCAALPMYASGCCIVGTSRNTSDCLR
jgi:hypothetical protein